MKKRYFILLCVGILLLLLAIMIFNATKYTCRVVTYEDISQFEEIANAESKPPFITDIERDKLLDRVVHKELKSFNDPITIEIENWTLGMCDGKETLLYVLTVDDADGFTATISVMIQSRW